KHSGHPDHRRSQPERPRRRARGKYRDPQQAGEASLAPRFARPVAGATDGGGGGVDAGALAGCHHSIVLPTSPTSSGSSKVAAVLTAPAASRSPWPRLVRIPIVAMPAAEAD